MGSPGMTSWKDSRPELLALLWVLPGLTERALTDQIAWNGIRHTATPEDEHHLLYPCLLKIAFVQWSSRLSMIEK